MTKNGIFSRRRRRCSKRRVCFHSNQYFYVPQENVNLSNEQRVDDDDDELMLNVLRCHLTY